MKSTLEDVPVNGLAEAFNIMDAIPAPEFLECSRRGLCCWRGLRLDSAGEAPNRGVLATHPERKPRSMSTKLYLACDQWFEQRFGWRARSNHSLFVSGSREQATQFGTAVMVIPLAPARYVWSRSIADLTRHLEALRILQPEEVAAVLEAGDYRDADLVGAIASGHEIMVRCTRYAWFCAEDGPVHSTLAQ